MVDTTIKSPVRCIMRIEVVAKVPIIFCIACEKELANNRLIFNQKHGIAAPLCDGCLSELRHLFIKPAEQPDPETTIFKFHYYPTKGYACSQPGDNTGYYVTLNDYERLKEVISNEKNNR